MYLYYFWSVLTTIGLFVYHLWLFNVFCNLSEDHFCEACYQNHTISSSPLHLVTFIRKFCCCGQNPWLPTLYTKDLSFLFWSWQYKIFTPAFPSGSNDWMDNFELYMPTVTICLENWWCFNTSYLVTRLWCNNNQSDYCFSQNSWKTTIPWCKKEVQDICINYGFQTSSLCLMNNLLSVCEDKIV